VNKLQGRAERTSLEAREQQALVQVEAVARPDTQSCVTVERVCAVKTYQEFSPVRGVLAGHGDSAQGPSGFYVGDVPRSVGNCTTSFGSIQGGKII
jgi:hypothetical protein